MWVLYLACLYFIAVMCAIGVISKNYDDNVGMRVGMVFILIGCIGRAMRLQAEQYLPPDSVLILLAMTCFAGGSAWRHIRWRRDERRQAERRASERRSTPRTAP